MRGIVENVAAADVLVFTCAAFLGALVTGMAGFAFGLVASAIWLHVITPSQSAALIAAFAIVIQSYGVWQLRRVLRPSRLVPFLAGSVLGIPLGAVLLAWASAAQMRTFVGVGLVLFSLYSLARPPLPNPGGGPVAEGAVGVVSGFLGASTGLAGIPVIVWSTIRGWTKDEQRAVFQPVAVAMFLMTLLWFGSSGTITRATIELFLLGLPAVLIGTWLGFKLYGKLGEAVFRKIVLTMLLASGLTLAPAAFQAGP
jgi:uncharacterized protein